MRLARIVLMSLLPMLMILIAIFPSASAQTGGRSDSDRPAFMKDQIPPAALLTDRGVELANRLKLLRISESRMGEKHPSFESTQTEILEIKRELAAWAPAEDLENVSSDASIAARLPLMNDRDLRQLVVQLVGQIQQLESRVSTLERSQADNR